MGKKADALQIELDELRAELDNHKFWLNNLRRTNRKRRESLHNIRVECRNYEQLGWPDERQKCIARIQELAEGNTVSTPVKSDTTRLEDSLREAIDATFQRLGLSR